MPSDSTHHSGSLVETIIDNLKLTLEWMDITTEAPFKARITGTLALADASISFPKSLRAVWNNLVIGHVDVKATYGVVPQDDKYADNVLLTPTSDHMQALFKEKSISIELQVEEVTVRAGHEHYPSVGASFRKSITVIGFDDLKDQITLGYIKFTGCEQNGDGVSGNINIAIKNPSSVSVLIDELPIDLCYKGAKIADLTMPVPFKLHYSSSGTEFRENVPATFKNTPDSQCKEFVADYITTPESLEISLCLDKTTIKLASSTISVPGFKSTCTVAGINKQFVKGVTAYVSLIRAPLLRKFDFTFDFENPVDTPVTITFIKGGARTKKSPLCRFHENMEMTVPANTTSTSHRIRKAALLPTLGRLMTFLGKTQIQVDVDIQHADISIGTFNLPNLAFNNLTDVRTRLKWSL